MSTAVSDDDVRPQAPGASDDDEPEAAEEAPAVSPYRRVGLSLREVLPLSFGVRPQAIAASAPPPAREEKRGARAKKLDVALARVATLEAELRAARLARQKQAPALPPASLEACLHCPCLQREVQRLTSSKQFYRKKTEEGLERIEELAKQHDEKLAAMESEHKRKLAAGRTKLDNLQKALTHRLEMTNKDMKEIAGENSLLRTELKSVRRDLSRELAKVADLDKEVARQTELLAGKDEQIHALETELYEIRLEAEVEAPDQMSSEDDEQAARHVGSTVATFCCLSFLCLLQVINAAAFARLSPSPCT